MPKHKKRNVKFTPRMMARLGIYTERKLQGRITWAEILDIFHKRYGVSKRTVSHYLYRFFGKLETGKLDWKKAFSEWKSKSDLNETQRRSRAKKASNDFWSRQSPDERHELAKKSHFALTPAERSNRSRKTAHTIWANMTPEKKRRKNRKISETSRRKALEKLGVYYIESLPVADYLNATQRNSLVLEKRELIERTVEQFRGYRYPKDVAHGHSAELKAIAVVSALSALGKWHPNLGLDFDKLIEDHIKFDLYRFLAEEKGKRIKERYSYKHET